MSDRKLKVTIVGIGMVGGTIASNLARMNLFDELALIDVVGDMAKGKALDISQAGPVMGYDTHIVGGDSWELMKNSDIVIVTAGVPRKPGMSREELLSINYRIIQEVSKKIRELAPNSIVIVVTNPLDAMTYAVYKITGFPKNRVLGMAGVLDTARFRTFLAWDLGVSAKDISALVLGSHGDTMVPILSYTTVGGIPIEKLLPQQKLEKIVERTKRGGAEVVELLKAGSAYFAPAASVCEMVEAIVLNRKRVLPCSVLCEGEYGINGIFIGVPVVLGRNGVEKIIEFPLREDELKALQKSADATKKVQDEVNALIEGNKE